MATSGCVREALGTNSFPVSSFLFYLIMKIKILTSILSSEGCKVSDQVKLTSDLEDKDVGSVEDLDEVVWPEHDSMDLQDMEQDADNRPESEILNVGLEAIFWSARGESEDVETSMGSTLLRVDVNENDSVSIIE